MRGSNGSHAVKKKSGATAFTFTIVCTLHGTITTTTLTCPPPLRLTRPRRKTRTGFRSYRQQPIKPGSLPPASSSSSSCRQHRHKNHGRPLRAHAGALQVRTCIYMSATARLPCLSVLEPPSLSASITHASLSPSPPRPHHCASPFHFFSPTTARPSRRTS